MVAAVVVSSALVTRVAALWSALLVALLGAALRSALLVLGGRTALGAALSVALGWWATLRTALSLTVSLVLILIEFVAKVVGKAHATAGQHVRTRGPFRDGHQGPVVVAHRITQCEPTETCFKGADQRAVATESTFVVLVYHGDW